MSPRGGGGLYLEGRFNGGFFALRFYRAYIWRGLYMEVYGTYSNSVRRLSQNKEAAILNKSPPL